MKKLPEEIKTLRRKIKSWLGVLTYDSAKGKLDRDVTSNRLQSVIEPVLKSNNIGEITNYANLDPPEVDDVIKKKRILRKMTPDNFSQKLSDIHEMLKESSFKKEEPSQIRNGFTIIVLRWAKITDQDLDFVRRVFERLEILFKEWQKETGLTSFNDSETYRNPEEYGKLFSSFSRILLEETPEEALLKARNIFIDLIKKYSEINLEDTLEEVLPPVTGYITRKTEEKLNSAFNTNPKAKRDISSPEVEALVKWEKEKQAWGGNTNRAIELLEGSLTSDSKTSIDQAGRAAILNSLKVIGRRSILTNLKDAIKGQLRIRLIDCALRWLKKCLLPKPRIIWDEEEGGNEVYKILMKGCEDGKS